MDPNPYANGVKRISPALGPRDVERIGAEILERRKRKHSYYIDIAKAVGAKSTCLRRKYGAIIVKNDEIVATGYNGSPRNCPNCSDIGECPRDALSTKKGDAYNLCFSVHAEMNAMLSAARRDMIGSVMYIVGINRDGTIANPEPCLLCHRMAINSGLKHVYGLIIDDDGVETITELDISGKTFVKRVIEQYESVLVDAPIETGSTVLSILEKYH